MIELENYKSNLDITDKNDIQKIKITKQKMYSGKTEYINPQIKELEHTSPLLAAAVIGLDNTGAPIPKNSKFADIWTDIDAQEINVKAKPTCFLIIGKTGSGAYNLAEAIAKKYNVIHLCPKNILVDEIAQKSSTGRTFDFNMRHSKVYIFDMVLTILKIKLNSEVVQHRGYVISGIPLVTCSRNHHYYINSIHGEEAFLDIDELLFDTIRNLKKKKPKPPGTQSSVSSVGAEHDEVEEENEEHTEDQQTEEDMEEEEDKPAELPKFELNSCSNVVVHKSPYFKTKIAVLFCQLKEIFNLSLKPDIIIHITCPEQDLIKMRNNRFINYHTGLNINEPFLSNYVDEAIWPCKYEIDDFVNPHTPPDFNPKYNLKSPLHLEEQIIEQICNYKKYVLPFVEKKLKDYDPKMIIELDGRVLVPQMLHHVSERLILLRIQPVLIPKPLLLEEPPDSMEEFWGAIDEFDKIHTDNIDFKLYASPWYNRCPVELKLRRSVVGKPKYAVRFFKHVYLLSSLNNFISFNRNPRPFLKLKYLEPTCRVVVMGTKNSGKTMISQCLSWIFDAPIFDFQTVVDTEKEKKYGVFAKTILSEIIATIEDARILEWQKTETERVKNLNEWCNTITLLLNKYIVLLKEKTQFEEKKAYNILKQQAIKADTKEEIEEEEKLSGDEQLVVEDEEEIDPALLHELNTLRMQLLFLPMLDSIEDCQSVLANQNIVQYAPLELVTVTNKPMIPVIGDEDVTIAISNYISANDLQKELEPTIEEVMTEIVRLITAIDLKHEDETQSKQLYGKYIIDGFPSDLEYWEHLDDPKITPDYTITLIENREIDENLYEYYNTDNYTKRYSEQIFMAKDPLIYTKMQVTRFSKDRLRHSDIRMIVESLIDDISNSLKHTQNPPSDANSQTQFITAFTEAIEKFRETWDSIKLKLEDKSKAYIEIELENKTDVKIIEEMLLKLRQSYRPIGIPNEDENVEEAEEDEDNATPKDLLKHNDKQFLCETNIYCPVAFYDYDILWKGNPEFSLKYENKTHYFCKEEFMEIFLKNITKYQSYNQPYKKVPTLKICIIGSIGSGKTSLSKFVAKELGLLHIDFEHVVNEYMVPKHYRKIGRQHEKMFVDEPLDEEGIVEFQIDEENENLLSDILGNEKEIIRMFSNYFERGTPVLSKLMYKMINRIWFDHSSKTGFVLDGYPRIPNDVEDMLTCYAIPDIVIEVENSSEHAINQTVPLMLKSWKSQQNEAKNAAAVKLDNERKEWMNMLTRKIITILIIEEVFENIFSEMEHQNLKSRSTDSAIIDSHPTGSANVDPVLFKLYNEMLQEYPEPKDEKVWEKYDEARERLEARVEGIFETDDENIRSVSEMLTEHRIKVVTVDGTKPFNKVSRSILMKLTELKSRCESFFEQTFIVKTEIAEMLLSRGYYLFSKFYRLCPVYIHDNPLAIQNSYKISRNKGTLFTVIHRSYIYFISNAENVIKFRTNPLKYITSAAIKSFFEYPLRIGVIGAPKSGTSTLAGRLAKQYGLLCISRGEAVRRVLKHMYWTQLAIDILKCLRKGKVIDDDHIILAIQTLAIDHRTVTHGYVLDGAPATPYRAQGYVKNGLYPNIIFDISSEKSTILTNSQNEIYYDILKYMPPYPDLLIKVRYEKWDKTQNNIRNWISDDYQNLFVLDGNVSRWKVLQQATDHLDQLTAKIHFYTSQVDKNIVRAMWISNKAFEDRQSQYEKWCPVCYHLKVYKNMGSYFGGKTGVVQYQQKFYWICDEHIDMVMAYPEYYLTYYSDVVVPELPAVIKIVNIDYIYQSGICIVTYAENLPTQVLRMGTNEFAASYDGKSYLFCSDLCLRKFLCKPYLYKDITIFEQTKTFPKLVLKKLPNIGYLEQTLGNMLTAACCSVNVFRPKYPGLSFQTSALIYIALYLKTHNRLMDKKKNSMYLKALKVFEARCKMILNVGLRLRSMNNPFATYPKCVHREPTLRPASGEEQDLCSSQIQGPSTVNTTRTSNYVQLHKPSFISASRKRATVISQMKRD